MVSSLFVYILDGASEEELITWGNLKKKADDLDAIILEVTDINAWQTLHGKLELDGWHLQSSGSGILQRVKTYGR